MEFSQLGKYCSYCGFLDYLPFDCEICKGSFCKNHRFHGCGTTNNCELDKLNKLNDSFNLLKIAEYKPKSKKSKLCMFRKCKKSIMTYKCRDCGKNYCITHRFHDEHKNRSKKLIV